MDTILEDNAKIDDLWPFDCLPYTDLNVLNENAKSFKCFVNQTKHGSFNTKKAPLSGKNSQNSVNKWVDKLSPIKCYTSFHIKDCKDLNAFYLLPVVDDKENRGGKKLNESSQKYQLSNISNRKLTETGGKRKRETEESNGRMSKTFKRQQTNSFWTKADTKVLEQSDIKLQEPNGILFNNQICEINSETLEGLVPASLEKLLLSLNNVTSPAKSVKILVLDDRSGEIQLNETFTMRKVDDDVLDIKKRANPSTSTPKSIRFSAKGSVRSQPVFKRLSVSVAASKSNFKSMAELLEDFEKKTRVYSPVASKPKVHCKVTRSIAPKLTAINRNRVAPLSSLEQELEYIRSHQFKATPFDRKMFDSNFHPGVKRVSPKLTTTPKSFVFHSDLRIKSRNSALHGHKWV